VWENWRDGATTRSKKFDDIYNRSDTILRQPALDGRTEMVKQYRTLYSMHADMQ